MQSMRPNLVLMPGSIWPFLATGRHYPRFISILGNELFAELSLENRCSCPPNRLWLIKENRWSVGHSNCAVDRLGGWLRSQFCTCCYPPFWQLQIIQTNNRSRKTFKVRPCLKDQGQRRHSSILITQVWSTFQRLILDPQTGRTSCLGPLVIKRK